MSNIDNEHSVIFAGEGQKFEEVLSHEQIQSLKFLRDFGKIGYSKFNHNYTFILKDNKICGHMSYTIHESSEGKYIDIYWLNISHSPSFNKKYRGWSIGRELIAQTKHKEGTNYFCSSRGFTKSMTSFLNKLLKGKHIKCIETRGSNKKVKLISEFKPRLQRRTPLR